jgi:hypothetical protein
MFLPTVFNEEGVWVGIPPEKGDIMGRLASGVKNTDSPDLDPTSYSRN